MPASGEILQANPRSSEVLIETVDTMRGATQAIVAGQPTAYPVRGGKVAALSEESFMTLRREFRDALAAIATERAALVAARKHTDAAG